MAEIFVSHVSFGERSVEIGYNEERDRSERVMVFRTIMIDRDVLADEIDELQALVQDVVDKGLQALLNPPVATPRKGF